MAVEVESRLELFLYTAQNRTQLYINLQYINIIYLYTVFIVIHGTYVCLETFCEGMARCSSDL